MKFIENFNVYTVEIFEKYILLYIFISIYIIKIDFGTPKHSKGCIITYFGQAVPFHKSLGKVWKMRSFLFCNRRRRWSLSHDATRCSDCILTLNYRDRLSKFINVLNSASYQFAFLTFLKHARKLFLLQALVHLFTISRSRPFLPFQWPQIPSCS